MVYRPRRPTITDLESLRVWVEDELSSVENELNSQTKIIPTTAQSVAPTKPRVGMVAYADGSNWNPGNGAGTYYFNGSLWLPTGYNMVDTDTTLAANSDSFVASQKAVKAYVDSNYGKLLLSGALSGTSLALVLTSYIATFRQFDIIFTELGDSADGNFRVRCSTDGGSSYDSTGIYTYAYDYINDANTYNSAASKVATGCIVGWGSSNALYKSEIRVVASSLNSTSVWKKFHSQGIMGSAAVLYNLRGGGAYQSTTAVNALEFTSDAGGTLSGNYAVFGVK